jgi:hypothetical protein
MQIYGFLNTGARASAAEQRQVELNTDGVSAAIAIGDRRNPADNSIGLAVEVAGAGDQIDRRIMPVASERDLIARDFFVEATRDQREVL